MKYVKSNYFVSSFIFIIFVTSCNTIKTDYYFPKGFTGDVALIYDCEGGQEVQIKNGRRQILIPDSGIVLLKAHFKEGPLDEKFYLKNEKGNFSEIYRYPLQKDTSDDNRHVYFERVTEVVGKGQNDKSFASMITFFYVGKGLELDTNR